MIPFVGRAVFISFLTLAILVPSPGWAQGQNSTTMREFVMSCTYGVLAGTLVGAASLAFTDQPGENLNRVARGASLGLYAGILLGIYVVYIVPNQIEEEELPVANRLQIIPLLGEKKLDGFLANYEVLSF